MTRTKYLHIGNVHHVLLRGTIQQQAGQARCKNGLTRTRTHCQKPVRPRCFSGAIFSDAANLALLPSEFHMARSVQQMKTDDYISFGL